MPDHTIIAYDFSGGVSKDFYIKDAETLYYETDDRDDEGNFIVAPATLMRYRMADGYEGREKDLSVTKDHIKANPEGWAVLYKGFVQGSDCHLPEIRSMELHYGDVIFICSDGVYNAFKVGELEEILESSLSIDLMIERIQKHCDSFARDNYSAILIKAYDNQLTTI